jgi:hypothetical protein
LAGIIPLFSNNAFAISGTLYGITGADSFSDFYELFPGTGTGNFIDTTGNTLSGIDFDFDGTLYAAGSSIGGAFGTIDPASGFYSSISNSLMCTDIAIDPTNGILYCQNKNTLYLVDKTTGLQTFLGTTGLVQNSGSAMDIASDGIMYYGNQVGLYTLSKTTGEATLVNNWTIPIEITSLGLTSCRTNAFDFDNSGTLWASLNCGFGFNNFLVTIDTTTAQMTFVDSTVSALDGIAFVPSVAIPNPLDLEIKKFNDVNANGFNDAEPPLAGWEFTVTDNVGAPVCNGVTDIAGMLSCTGIDTILHPTPYLVEETPQPGYLSTTGIIQSFTPRISPFFVEFGNVAAAEIHGLKWNDQNADGIRDAGEPGVAGINVCISPNQAAFAGIGFNGIQGSFQCVLTMTDDTNTPEDETGMYWIKDVPPGDYLVHESLPIDQVQTFPPNGESHLVILSPGQILSNIDFGNVLGAQISGTKWGDTNGDGVKDLGESGIPSVEIQLFKLTSATIGTYQTSVFTGTFGEYMFSGLLPGSYRLEEVTPFGTSQTFPASGQPQFVALGVGETRTGIDFGNTAVPTGAISGTKWHDTNADGIKDLGENGVSGIQICVSPLWQCTLTDINGFYQFTNTPAGSYNVYEYLPSGSTNTTPLTRPATVTSGVTTANIDFGNTTPFPPPPEVTITGLSPWRFGNLPVIFWGNPTTYTKNVGVVPQPDHCGVDQPTSVTLTITFPETNGVRSKLMTQQGTSELWSATFGPFFNPGDGSTHIDHGTASLRFDVTCPFSPDEIQNGGNVYIDPSGTVTNSCDATPLDGATVTILQEFPPTSGIYIPVSSPTLPPGFPSILPDVNPQTTDITGAYGWVVIPGNWKVKAEKIGFDIVESSVLSIPPAVTDLTLSLTPDAGCPVPSTIPIANAGADQSVPEGTPVLLDGTGSTDADGDTLTYFWTQISGPIVILTGETTASPTFTAPSVGPAGDSLGFELTVSDGNDSPTDSVVITVTDISVPGDVTPPEAYNQFDPVTKDVKVFGTDDTDGDLGPIIPVVTLDGNKEIRTYTIQDSAGNKLVLVEKVKMGGKEIKVDVQSLQYNDGTTIDVDAEKKFSWSLNKDGTIKELEQHMKIKQGHDETEDETEDENKQDVKAKFDSKKNQTKIKSENPETKETLSGMILLKMSTDDGNLIITH